LPAFSQFNSTLLRLIEEQAQAQPQPHTTNTYQVKKIKQRQVQTKNFLVDEN
jgi:hypothetical protein